MSSKLLRASCISFCALSLAVAEPPSKAKVIDTQKAVDQKVDAKVSKTPIGTLTADSPVRINGLGLDGTTAWPVFPGDVIETYSTDAKLKMKDGRSALLRKLSAIAVSGALATVALTVNRGSAAIYDSSGNMSELAPQTSGPLFTTPSGKASAEPQLAGESKSWKCIDPLLANGSACTPEYCAVGSPDTKECCQQGAGTSRCL